MVHGAHEVHVENQRNGARLAEAAIGESDAIGLDELGRSGLVRIRRHLWVLLRWPWPINPRSCRRRP
jgi:hypothetical protein